MQYAQVTGVEKQISRIVLGTMIISPKARAQSFSLLDSALKMGCNTFDTAHIYGGGMSERGLGAWLKERKNREDVVIVSKGAHPNEDRRRVTAFDITSDLHDSLARLNSDYIDIYLLHRDDPAVPVGPIMEVLNEHLRSGKIRALGASNWRHERIQKANEYAEEHNLVPFVISSPHFSLIEQVKEPWGPGCVSLTGEGEDEARRWYHKTQMAVFAWSSLSRGLLSGRISRDNFANIKDNLESAVIEGYCYEDNFKRLDRAFCLSKQKDVTVPQIGTAYVVHQSMNVFPIIGAAGSGELKEVIKALDLELTDVEMDWLNLKA